MRGYEEPLGSTYKKSNYSGCESLHEVFRVGRGIWLHRITLFVSGVAVDITTHLEEKSQ